MKQLATIYHPTDPVSTQALNVSPMIATSGVPITGSGSLPANGGVVEIDMLNYPDAEEVVIALQFTSAATDNSGSTAAVLLKAWPNVARPAGPLGTFMTNMGSTCNAHTGLLSAAALPGATLTKVHFASATPIPVKTRYLYMAFTTSGAVTDLSVSAYLFVAKSRCGIWMPY